MKQSTAANELHRVEKIVKSRARRTVWDDGFYKGAQQALAWALGLNAVSPSSFRKIK